MKKYRVDQVKLTVKDCSGKVHELKPMLVKPVDILKIKH